MWSINGFLETSKRSNKSIVIPFAQLKLIFFLQLYLFNEMRKFTALYTHQKHKKIKAWQEGVVHYNSESNEFKVYDESNQYVAGYRLRAKDTVEISTEYDIGRYLLTLENEEERSQPPVATAATTTPALSRLPRVKRPPSLIKPIKLKPDFRKKTVSPAPAVSSVNGNSNSAVEYSVLHTTQKVKKVKAWAEGLLLFHQEEHRVVLKDEDGNTLTNTHMPRSKTIDIGDEVDVGIYLVQIECLKGQENKATSSSEPTAAAVSRQLQGVLKRRHEKVDRKESAVRDKFQKTADSLSSLSTRPQLHNTASSTVSNDNGNGRTMTNSPPPRVPVVTKRPPPSYLHFPRRGELLQHVSISKGYGFGPPRQLIAPVSFTEWEEYQQTFASLLRENLMAELSALAIRYFFMAREKFDSSTTDTNKPTKMSYNRSRKRSRLESAVTGGGGGGLYRICKSVGVLYFGECSINQPFMDSAAFKAQLNRGKVNFSKGDSVILELSRRENFAGYAKDDTWAISTTDEFSNELTFLARSVFFGPSKNNMLELMLVGDEDAKIAAKVFNSTAEDSTPGKTSTVVCAIRCLDSASDWSMIDTVEESLNPETLPLLPLLLQQNDGQTIEPPLKVCNSKIILARAEDILEAKRQELNLNQDQNQILRQVVMSAISLYIPMEGADAITIVHGPFGTGKSFLIGAIVICLDLISSEFPEVFGEELEEEEENQGEQEKGRQKQTPRLRVLLSSMTNFAVDNMLSALLRQGYDQFMRVGNLKRISKQSLPYVCRSSSGATEDVKELEDMLEQTENETEREFIATAIQRMRQQRMQDVLNSAFAVGTTCLSTGTAALRGEQFPLVILDEACQIVEPMALIALANAGCHRLVLVGDPLQLPPTLTTRSTKTAEGKGLDRALFDRLVQMGKQPRFLSTQYRCHPRIGSLCNQLFYNGRLQHGVAAGDRQPLLANIPPLVFLDTAGQEKQHGKSQSFFNKGEIDMVIQIVRQLLEAGVDGRSIGVVTLYKIQSDMLRDQLSNFLGKHNSVQVSTVDAYQGSEREIMIISCVRTEKIGFISNPNRINVALSRARRHCLILGSRKLLETNGLWRRILEYCRADSGSMGVMSAQSLVNRLGNSVVSHAVVEEEKEEDVQHLETEADDVPDEEEAEEEERVVFEEEEGVVGGFLSQQWSLPTVSQSLTQDDEDNVLGCLDVDLDQM